MKRSGVLTLFSRKAKPVREVVCEGEGCTVRLAYEGAFPAGWFECGPARKGTGSLGAWCPACAPQLFVHAGQ